MRTPRGRMALPAAYKHMNLKQPEDVVEDDLFSDSDGE